METHWRTGSVCNEDFDTKSPRLGEKCVIRGIEPFEFRFVTRTASRVEGL